MSKIKKSVVSFVSACLLLIMSALPIFGFAQTVNKDVSNAELAPPSALPVMEKYFGYDCKLTFSTDSQWLKSVHSVTVNGEQYNCVENSFGVWNDTDYYVSPSDSYILIGEQGMTQNTNIVIISADGYDDLIFEINKERTSIVFHSHSGGTATCAQQAQCAVCGVRYGELSADHCFGAWQITVQSDCTNSGTEERSCTVCGYNEIQTIPSAGHKETVADKTDATCTEYGFSGNIVCEICGEILETGSIIPKTEHLFNDGICEICGFEKPTAESKPTENTEDNKEETTEDNTSSTTASTENNDKTTAAVVSDKEDLSVRSENKTAQTSADKDLVNDKNNLSKTSPKTGNEMNYAVLLAFAFAGSVVLIMLSVEKSINKRKQNK